MLAKLDLNTIEYLFSKFLIDPNISHDIFNSFNDILKEYSDMKN